MFLIMPLISAPEKRAAASQEERAETCASCTHTLETIRNSDTRLKANTELITNTLVKT